MANEEERQSKRLREIAAVLAQEPGQSYKRIAERVGVSRRTLYRIAPTRQELIELLRQEAVRATFAAINRAGIEKGPILEALERLTHDFIADADLYGFWVAESRGQNVGQWPLLDQRVEEEDYHQIMTSFFKRGQHEGVFSGNMSPSWLMAFYDSLLMAVTECRRTGSVAARELPQLLLESFLHGAGKRSESCQER